MKMMLVFVGAMFFLCCGHKAADGSGEMKKIEPEDFQAMFPVFEIRFLGIAQCGVAGEAGGNDQVGAGAEEFDAGLVADFHAAAGEEGDAAFEIGGFGAFAEIQFGAGGAELVVEMVNC